TDAELARVPDPDDWCDNCIRAQVLSPRKKANRSRHCKWCITVRQTYGSLPSIEAIKMHHESGSSRALHRLLSGRPVGRRTALALRPHICRANATGNTCHLCPATQSTYT